VTAYQIIHRTAQMKPGQRALVTGASGGVGSALLELLRLHGVETIGAASPAQHAYVRSLGATPIESRSKPLGAQVRAISPEGVDVAFDGIGGKTAGECIGALKRGGLMAWYGFTSSVKSGGRTDLVDLMRGMFSIFVAAPLRGRKHEFYGITALYRKDPKPFHEDLPKLFELLATGKIKPTISEKLPLLEARRANELLEKGGVRGKIVLVA